MVSFTMSKEVSPIKVDDRLRGDEGSALRAMSGTISPTYVRVGDARFKPRHGGNLPPVRDAQRQSSRLFFEANTAKVAAMLSFFSLI